MIANDHACFAFPGWNEQLRRDVEAWSADELAAGLRQLSGLRAALDACEARLLSRFDALQGWKATGAVDAASWLRDQTGTSARQAAGRAGHRDGPRGAAGGGRRAGRREDHPRPRGDPGPGGNPHSGGARRRS
jgi:hypothetical protein